MKQRTHIKETWIKSGVLITILIIVLFGIFTSSPTGSKLNLLDVHIMNEIAVHDVILLLLMGFISGTIGGALGMGGGVVKIANLHLVMGFEILFARIIS